MGWTLEIAALRPTAEQPTFPDLTDLPSSNSCRSLNLNRHLLPGFWPTVPGPALESRARALFITEAAYGSSRQCYPSKHDPPHQHLKEARPPGEGLHTAYDPTNPLQQNFFQRGFTFPQLPRVCNVLADELELILIAAALCELQ